MLRLANTRLTAGVLILSILAGTACTAKKWPGIRKPRNPDRQERTEQGSGPEVEAPSTPEEGVSAPPAGSENNSNETSTSEASSSVFVETSLPGQTASLMGAPQRVEFAFNPEVQRKAADGRKEKRGAPAGQHPRLYFDADELKELQSKATGPSKYIGDRIFAFGDKIAGNRKRLPPVKSSDLGKATATWRNEGDRLMGVAAAFALSTNQQKKQRYGDWAVEAMRRMAGWDVWGPTHEYDIGLDGAHILFGFSVAYDLLYDRLNATERDKFAARIKRQAEQFYAETQKRDPEFWTKSYTNNHNFINHNALLNAALVIEDRYPREAKAWIDQCVRNTAAIMRVRELIGDGSTNEGVMYGTYGSHGLFTTIDLLHEHKLADHFDNTWLEQHFNFLLHGSLPGFTRVVGIADSHGIYGHGPRHLLYFLDRVTRDGRPTWFAQRIDQTFGRRFPYGKPEGSNLLFEILWHDPAIEPRPITNTDPGLYHFEDWGVVTYRRGWSAKDTFFSFKSGDPAGKAAWDLMLAKDPRLDASNVSHSHPDAGSFTFFPGGTDFLSGALYPKPKRTALNNTYTFTPGAAIASPVPQKAIQRMWDPKKISQIGRLDEVGQSGEWAQWMGPTEALLKLAPRANIVTAVEQGGGVFVSGEFGKAYPDRVRKRDGGMAPLGLDRVYRSVLLLPEDVLLIVDRVETRGQVGANSYFRALSSKEHRTSWTAAGSVATLSGGGYPGGQIEIFHPKGVKAETGRELISYEDAKGENRRGVKDWNTVSHSSVYARFSNPKQSGAETYVYIVRPKGKKGVVTNLSLADARGVALNVETDTRTYEVKVATDLAAQARRGFLGFDGHVKVDYIVNP
jgi:hypothetical protein